jgi:hypothetical protein
MSSPSFLSPGYESTAMPIALEEIRTEYHPNSGRPTTTRHIDDPSLAPPSTYPLQSQPWSPFFETREDFMLSEVILDGCLGSELADKLLKIFELCNSGEGKVTFKTFSQVQAAFQRASVKLSPMSTRAVSRRRAYLS